MEYKLLGRSGLKVSAVGLGCNNFSGRIDEEQTRAVVHRALDEGITLFDTADLYGVNFFDPSTPGSRRGASEELLSKALGNRRHEAVIATKFGGPMGEGVYMRGGSRRYIMAAAEASLKRLATDYIDLYQIHFPDPSTPQEETLRALDDLVRAGKVRYIGCSNFAGWQVADATWISRNGGLTPYISAQNEYNIMNRRIERDLVPACDHFGLGILPYSPLANGLLTGKYHRGEKPPAGTRLAASQLANRVLNEENFNRLDTLEKFATSRGHTLLDLAVGWLASQPLVSSVICGATKPEQVTDNVKAGQWQLSEDELKEIDAL